MKNVINYLTKILLVVILCFVLVGCTSKEQNTQRLSYVHMRINPEIELVVDENGIVVAANAVNEDGATVLVEIELIGLTVEEASELFTSMAVELGFIDVDAENAIVYIFASAETEEEAKELEDKVCDKIKDFFKDKGINGKPEREDIENLKAIAEEWEVSLKDAKIIQRVLELYPEKTKEEILELSFKEILELIKEDSKNNGISPEHRDEYKEEVEDLKEEYKELFEVYKQIKEIEKQLRNKDLTEEEKAALELKLEELKKEYKEEKEDFNEELEEIKKDKIQKVKGLEEEYAAIMAIRDKVVELKLQLEELELTEEEKTSIEAEIEALKAEYENLKVAYQEAIKALKEEKEAKVEELKKLFEELIKARKELRELKWELKFEELTEEAKTEIEALIASLETKYEELKAKYNELKDEIHGNHFGKDDDYDDDDDEDEDDDDDHGWGKEEQIAQIKQFLEELQKQIESEEIDEKIKEALQKQYDEFMKKLEELQNNCKEKDKIKEDKNHHHGR